MREIRTYGSEGGAAGKPAVPTPIRTAYDEDYSVQMIRHYNEFVGMDFFPHFC